MSTDRTDRRPEESVKYWQLFSITRKKIKIESSCVFYDAFFLFAHHQFVIIFVPFESHLKLLEQQINSIFYLCKFHSIAIVLDPTLFLSMVLCLK